MTEKKVIIGNRLGLHMRPAGEFVQRATRYESKVLLIKDGFEANAKSILNVLLLQAEKDSELLLKINGPDEEEALAELSHFLENEFDYKE